MQTKVKSLMTEEPVIIDGSANLKEAAKDMRAADCGVLPVGSWDALQGMITDRDIVIRAVAEGVDPTTARVQDFMTTEVFYCNENDTLEQAASQMCQHGVSRLVVKNDNGRACGIITFGCILRKDQDMREIGRVVASAIGKKAA